MVTAVEHNIGMRAYVGVTDSGWYRFLAARPEVTEVNFWRRADRPRREFLEWHLDEVFKAS
jgi:hypothetical protein